MAQNQRIWYLRRVNLFESLSDREIEEISALFALHVHQPGEPIAGPSTPPERVYLVKEGLIRLFHRGPDGREITAETVGPGELFGVSALFGSAADHLLAEAMTEAVVCLTEGRQLLPLLARWPQVAVSVIQQLARQVFMTEQQIEQVATGDARTRLADLLSRLAREAGESVPRDGIRLPHFTHDALARQIGVSRETITRQLAALEADGFIRRQGRRIVLLDSSHFRQSFGLSDD